MNRYQIINISFIVLLFSCQNSTGQNEQLVNSVNDTTVATIYNSETSVNDKSKKLISIIGVCDMMLGTNYPARPNYLPPNKDCKPLLKDVKPILLDADLTFGNCEGVFSDDIRYARSCGSSKNCYHLNRR